MTDIKDTVYNDLVLRIVTQQLKPGERLHEKDIVEHYGIGKMPLREVLLVLQANGLIRRFPRSGTIIAPIDIIDLRESAEIRVALEYTLCNLVIDRISNTELEELEGLTETLNTTSSQGITPEFIVLECRLHALLHAASKNNKMARMLDEQQHIFSRLWHSFERSQGDLQSQVNDWTDICAAIRAKDKVLLKQVYSGHFKFFYETLSSLFRVA